MFVTIIVSYQHTLSSGNCCNAWGHSGYSGHMNRDTVATRRSHTLKVRMNDDEWRKLEQVAEKARCNKSDAIRGMVNDFYQAVSK
jgi:hypothetical protein